MVRIESGPCFFNIFDFKLTCLMRLLVVVFSLHFFGVTYAQDCNNMVGQWVNELGSVFIIEKIEEDGKILGKYASSTGVDGKVFPLSGWSNRSADHPDEVNIAFSVRWEGYGSITSWTGYCLEDESGAQIKTVWNLVRSGKDFDWERIITNASTFVSQDK